MTRSTEGRRLALVLVFGLAAASVGLLWHSVPSPSDWHLLTVLSAKDLGEGKFFRSSLNPPDPARFTEALGKAQLLLLTGPDSPTKRRIRALLNASQNNIPAAADDLRQLSEKYPYDAEILNDLGVIYLSMGEESAANYFRAAQVLDRSLKLAPQAPAPAHNAAIVSRKIRLKEQANETSSPGLLDRIGNAQTSDAALQLLNKDRASYRHAAVARLLNPSDEPVDRSVHFVVNYFSSDDRDPTLRAMREPLTWPDRQHYVRARRSVQSGIDAYLHGKWDDASRAFDLAEAVLKSRAPGFDDLWIKLNRADSELRAGRHHTVRELLNDVIAEARSKNYKWLLGKALATKSSDYRLVSNYEELLQTLNEAVTTLTAVDAPQDATRAMDYLAVVYFMAGDFEKSLDVAYKALSVTPVGDHHRRSQLLITAGVQLYRLGMQEYSIPTVEQAMLEAERAKNPPLVSATSANLAILHAAKRDFQSAEKYYKVARDSADQIETAQQRELSYVSINLLCARIGIFRGNFTEAERCLIQNTGILERYGEQVPYFVVQTLLHLAETQALQNRFDLSRATLRKAADFLEVDDAYLAAGVLRMSFENERRAFYEKAITFEFEHGTTDRAWEYTQRYRTKLFLEFLGQLNPGIAALSDATVDRNEIQHRIPPKVKVIEYVALQDRLLIWLVSDHTFTVTTVRVSRAELERKIEDFLRRIQEKGDHRELAQELHRLLIEPVENQLQPGNTLALIPDQALHRLNFPALYSQSKKAYLIERFAILENPSLASLLLDGAGRPPRENAIGFGAQTDDTNATAELGSLARFYPRVQSFNGLSALKAAFLTALETAGIFHYAGHSRDASDPLRSAVLLDGNREGDNSVTAVDIIKRRMHPNAVVVLASCDSSVGNSRDGVSMRGLTSAFLISGAGSVVGSLWLVEAKSTSRLVLEFHKGFAKDNLPVAEALRQAQLKFVADGMHPYYWSGFVVTGNTSALR
jgi:CHAT domain-containing protein